MLDIKEIQKILFQRYPLLMLDRIVEIEPGQRVIQRFRRSQPVHRRMLR